MQKKKKNKDTKKIPDKFKEPEYPSLPDPFFCQLNNIKVRKGDSRPLTIQYMPFVLENYRCKLVFCDPSVGEF